MDELIKTILEMGRIRGDIPQFLFSDSIFHPQTIAVRNAVLNYKKEGKPMKEVDVIIHSAGGLADDAYRIIRTFRSNFETVNVIVPFWAKSAATLLSLGASKIIMDEFGEFGPLDAQLGKVRDDSPELDRESALNDEHSLRRIETRFKEMFETIFIRIFEHKRIDIPKAELSKQLFENLSKFYEPLLKQIDPYKLGEKRRKLDIGGHYAKRILGQFSSLGDVSKIRDLVDYLVEGCPDHGYVIDYSLIKVFLGDTVSLSEDFFGKDYAQLLSELSGILIGQTTEDLVAFIEPEVVSEIDEPFKGDSVVDDVSENPAVDTKGVIEEHLHANTNGLSGQSLPEKVELN